MRPKRYPLTAREREILQLVALGMTNKRIAQQLSISHKTVEAHLQNIYRKLGVRNRTEAAMCLSKASRSSRSALEPKAP